MSQPQRFVLFPLGTQRFALPASIVAELAQQGKVQEFPQTSPLLCGVLLRRGVIIAVCDLAQLLVAPPRPPRKYFLIVWRQLGAGREMLAIPVSGECELCSVAPAEPRGGLPGYVTALLALPGETIEVLDLEKVLASTGRAVVNGGGAA
jgi:chemotaxis signal transduction protein